MLYPYSVLLHLTLLFKSVCGRRWDFAQTKRRLGPGSGRQTGPACGYASDGLRLAGPRNTFDVDVNVRWKTARYLVRREWGS